MTTESDVHSLITRRTALKSAACGFGYLAFADLATRGRREAKRKGPLAPKPPHFPARAKRVIFLCMEGAPSHVDTFDYKPKLVTDDGKPFSGPRSAAASCSARRGSSASTARAACGSASCSRSWRSMPTSCACVNGMHTDVPTHPQAFLQMHTGSFQFKRPTLGAWTVYGLGTDNETCRASSPSARRSEQRRPDQLRQRLPAGRLPGHADRRRPGSAAAWPAGDDRSATSRTPGSRRTPSGMQLDFMQSLNRGPGARPGQPGDRGGHRVVRAGLPHAEGSAEADGPASESAETQGALRHRRARTTERLRPAVPAGPPVRRGRACASSRSRAAAGTTTAT